MSTNFPTSLDIYSRIVDNSDTILAVHINNVQDAIEALEAKVGVNNDILETLDFKITNFFTNSRYLYFYEDTPPTNWVTQSAIYDRIIGLKGGSYYTSGGTTYGSSVWDITGWDTDTHTHPWFVNSGAYTYTYNSSGTTINMNTNGGAGEQLRGEIIEIFNDACIGSYEHVDTWDSGYAWVKIDMHNHTHYGTWRPPGAIGIIAKYNGL